MRDLQHRFIMLIPLLESRLREAVSHVLNSEDLASVQIRPSNDPRHGDYQSSSLMQLAKQRGIQPRQVATEVVGRLKIDDLCDAVEIAGPGFLNFKVRSTVLGEHTRALLDQPNPWKLVPDCARTYVVDFSSPNVAKPMHVGHIRSTALGDCLARILRFQGHHVHTDNHIGDWGTQFGMLLVGWKKERDPQSLAEDPLGELERIYKLVHQQCQENPETLAEAREELVRLQAGDPENRGIWEEMIRISQVQFDTVYRRLGVSFDHCLGESFYNPWLQQVVDELLASGIARVSDGAVGVFSDGTKEPNQDPFLIQRDGEWRDNPVLIRKSDGGFNYATTDLATLMYRMREWTADEIVYVTDGRQQQHFRQVFETFQRWQPELAAKVRLVHAWFGSILGADGKPFKTRSGETVKLAELLDEAEERAMNVVREKRPDLPESQRQEIARVVGVGALKYQDLLSNRQSDYVFSWDKMLALQGNTAPYLQYQYTRANKVLRDATASAQERSVDLSTATEQERTLAKQLLYFGLALESVTQEYRPNLLCNYLYELAGCYSRFYEACPILNSEEPTRSTRLALCELTARTLRQGLDCLGIDVVETM